MVKENKVISSALLLGAGTFVAKLIGAIYRIPLTRFLGAEGIGIYQMVFPVYALLLDFSGAGVPNALSKIISGEENKGKAYSYLYTSLKLFFIVGIVGTGLMLALAIPLSKLQLSKMAVLCYATLSPAVLMVSLISCFRGFFQGNMKMLPTASSQVIEQVIKLAVGLWLCFVFRENLRIAVASATFAVTISEIVCLLYLYALFLSYKKKNGFIINSDIDKRNVLKNIIRYTVPITILGLVLPFSQILDGILTVNILSRYLDNATSLYGLLSGVVLTVINLPVGICHGIATATIPAVSKEKEHSQKSKRAVGVLLLTLFLSGVFAFITYFFAPIIIRILFSSLSSKNKEIAVSLLRLTSFSIVFLSVLQTSNAVLIGMNSVYLPIFSLIVGVIIKTVLNVILLGDKRLNIYGGGVALIACYFFACLVNLIMIIAKENGYARKRTANRRQKA